MRSYGEVKSVNKKYVSNMVRLISKDLRSSGCKAGDVNLLLKIGSNIYTKCNSNMDCPNSRAK